MLYINKKENMELSIFERHLAIWVLICIVIGILIGEFIPIIPETLNNFEYYKVSVPVAVLIWLMIYPMMLKIDFKSIVSTMKKPKGLIVTCTTNWLIKPFTMYIIASFFFLVVFKSLIPEELAKEYMTGTILLGAAPCTAMVLVWSHLAKGDPAYTLVQVAINDLIILVAFAPIVAFLLGVGKINVPIVTLILSIILFLVIPLAMGLITRNIVIKRKGIEYFQDIFLKKFNNITVIGLLLTLIIIFSFQGHIILNNPLHIILIAIPLIIQTLLIFAIAYGIGILLELPHSIAAPAAIIGASNFFELAVAVAIALFGLQSGAVLAAAVGVLVEVSMMLIIVKITNRTRAWFSES